ncbi:MPP_PhoD superfamily domain-containing protein [Histoplasma ohiense]|nr:MPP_PhoD superfamily domain-containing protein [Histoplasma ohiense (nom. inval.)]
MENPLPPAVTQGPDGQPMESTSTSPSPEHILDQTCPAVPEGYEHVLDTSKGYGNGPGIVSLSDHLEVLCGPLLNYKGFRDANQEFPTWQGSVLLVTKPGQKLPVMELRPTSSLSGNGSERSTLVNGNVSQSDSQVTTVEGVKLFADPNKAFWRFSVMVPLQAQQMRWEYSFPRFHYFNHKESAGRWSFVVPGANDSMRIMFHSCNGFSIGTDLDYWQGPLLWNEVLHLHEERPFHVMIGGGDQIYNDSVRVDGPLKEWTDISNPHKRRTHPFPEKMRNECDSYYYENYIKWYGMESFATANSQIPQINIWDDHDIIDGFGSYTDHFMKCAVFRGIGGVAFKYYLLFQHHVAPPVSTFTTDSPETMSAVNGTSGPDPRQLEHAYVYKEVVEDPSFITGKSPGPYLEERSRNLYMRLGRRMAFAGVDARTERTRHQVNYQETYDMIFSRLDQEIAASNGDIKHLILLLGVPIAYPRLAWLENLIRSPLIAPIRLLNKRFGVGGSFFNKFDGQVDLLDDLDDHYTARQHKRERRELIQSLQHLSRKHSVRVTILGGDVHLAAMGRFYSKPELNIPADRDFRYMPNVISSAITNKPPPKAVANLLAHRNKIHHLDHDTDETLMKLFDKQPGGKEKGAAFNKVTMPSRNFACITEVSLDGAVNGSADVAETATVVMPKDGHDPLHAGEENAGTTHRAADGVSNVSGMIGGLDVAIRVEIDAADRNGTTEGYGFSVPPLSIPPNDRVSQETTRSSRFRRMQRHLHSSHSYASLAPTKGAGVISAHGTDPVPPLPRPATAPGQGNH